MKPKSIRYNMTKVLLLTLTLTTATAIRAAQTTLTTQHVDIGIAYDLGAFDLHIHNETDDVEFSPPNGPDGAILQVGAAARTTVPTNPAFSFLGSAGSDIWILPNTQNPNLIFLGFGAEELAPADWIGNITMSLKSVSGPGNFSVFDTDSFGNPIVLMNSGNGITGADAASVVPGSHGDFNWGFSAPGTYVIEFEATGVHAVDGAVASGPVAYQFNVVAVPEPGTYAFLGMGALTLIALAKRRRSLG